MPNYENLIELLADARSKDRHIRFIDGEHDESTLSFRELWDRAIALLGALQARGMHAGDELVVFCNSNESFVVAIGQPCSAELRRCR
jgi:acyl-CoA synthetase (AMP-forming)/AMP-acid ligase II